MAGPKLPPSPPMIGRIIVATIATFAGAYVVYDTGKDFEFIKFEPRTSEEIEQRKKEHVGMSIKQLETRTLEYTPEARSRLKKLIEEKEVSEKGDQK
ncbi:hypothetical protein PSN45_003042 [Yamadazyma tenuis]|uniref:Uncharacterized protein n=1 Tax=Candida tenuis (strain ATCC 10573 / BCRC 21748 / CBS 615 / JCM 9827 / NBRC 10315 / NRRL Y-1498 / VKM Y-70) TaxID=590646 RepID=G3AXE1_CANTC|nr:uncharacterized protein CANTEDRAFT_117099 [Yamadazyma tenuis ATCC 10573]XP_006683608.1 uncharacterized protein CANTEDRAFT_117099 [Yamadazyma tenuis ATCC 10573]EGV66349.1 hypothetical protein CANTEDRAFT_117099 [Yamadazyma tenuis ATCC 10573]EGV66350.1 hypothetical protein CANTEDRAFT_117099 [Yamadazyma tenuis ATCC 10573]WEJ95522.1 hypothetical protein PSN45_003042 [Yamadazyma tenuis]